MEYLESYRCVTYLGCKEYETYFNRTQLGKMSIYETISESNFPFQFSTIAFSDVILEKARHINEQEQNGKVIVYLDIKQTDKGIVYCNLGIGNTTVALGSVGKVTF